MVVTEAAARRASISAALEEFLLARELPPSLECAAQVRDILFEYLSGGERLRGQLCYWGFRGGGGDPDDQGILRAAAAIELLHASGLIHDDLVDGSSTRRGKPSLHIRMAELVPDSRERLGGPVRSPAGLPYGHSLAVWAGDMCAYWSNALLSTACADPSRMAAAREIYHDLITETLFAVAQEVIEAARGPSTVRRAVAINIGKTARYTFESPLRIGGALAGAAPETMTAYAAYAVPAGEVIQLNDDLLVFEDPGALGEEILDDLRAGTATVLTALAVDAATPAQLDRLSRLHGKPDLTLDEADELRQVLVDTGARDRCERMKSEKFETALHALQGIPAETAEALREILVRAFTRRR
ncbi:polyprenyl synthetase family protein [Nocardiopsis rhodophaea]|uniref:polyprenyl synthetase family protein n=1 Tax=Nocardiopsis rhodophaea TaxID=280238 RepID=UPI0031DFAC70